MKTTNCLTPDPDIPPAAQLLAKLEPLTSLLYRCLPEAAQTAVAPYFERRGRAIDRAASTNMLRYEALSILSSQGIVAQEECALNRLPNNGVEGNFRGHRFKILRSLDDKGAVPPPGGSHRRESFFCQGSPFPQLPFPSLDASPGDPNVVGLWHFDQALTRLTLWLAVPKGVSGPFGPVECHYIVLVPDATQTNINDGMDAPPDLDVQWKHHADSEGTVLQDDLQREDKASEGA